MSRNVEQESDFQNQLIGQKIIKMAEKVQNFRAGQGGYVRVFKAENLEDILEGLCLSPGKKSEKKGRKKTAICQIFGRLSQGQFYQISTNNQKIELFSRSQSPPLPSELQHMSCFEMLINFKIQTQQNKIQILHELLYLFSLNKPNISHLFSQMMPHFIHHQTSFAHQIGWLIKFSKDKRNYYAIGFFSEIISKIVEELPEVGTNTTQIYELTVLLVQTLGQVQKKEEGFLIFKAIHNLVLTYEGIGSKILCEKGKQLIDFTSKNLDYSIEYMLVKILRLSNLQKQSLSYMIDKFLELFHNENIKTETGFPTKSSLYSSIFRIINQIESILAQKTNKKISEFIENRKNIQILNQLYQFEQNKNQNYESFRTKVLVTEFKKMKIRKNIEAHQIRMKDLSENQSVHGRKLVKKEMEEEFR